MDRHDWYCWADEASPTYGLQRRAPELVEEFSRRHWPLPASIDRVYVIEKAKACLNYTPQFGFREVLKAKV